MNDYEDEDDLFEEWSKNCGFCKYFKPIPDPRKDIIKWGICLADPELSEEAFHVDDPACEYWIDVNE